MNPRIRMLPLSAKTGEGLAAWYDWLAATRQVVLAGTPHAAAAGA